MSDRDIEPEIVEAVLSVGNRYGASGLEDLIALAEEQLEVARAALAALEEIAAEPE